VDLPGGGRPFFGLAPPCPDADVFPDPDTFDPERPNSRRTLAFGRGIHFCIGSALGRLEATLALEELTRRFPGLRLAPPDQEIPFHPNISFRGPQILAVQA
jgi:cytochrome P450